MASCHIFYLHTRKTSWVPKRWSDISSIFLCSINDVYFSSKSFIVICRMPVTTVCAWCTNVYDIWVSCTYIGVDNIWYVDDTKHCIGRYINYFSSSCNGKRRTKYEAFRIYTDEVFLGQGYSNFHTLGKYLSLSFSSKNRLIKEQKM